MGTDNGVLRWNGTRLDRFTVQDGLSGRETNRAAGVLDSRGQVWIGTDQGVSVYRAQYDQPPRPPMVELHGVVVGVEEVPRPLSGRLDLETTEDDLTFRFRALSFRDEKRLLFRSRLEGYEETWLQAYTSPDQEIRYTNLPPGRYRFHLQASGAEGEWSEPVVSSRIVLAAPLWQRWWFLLGMLLLVAMLVYGIERAVAQWRFSGRLLQEVSQRTAELAVANRDLETLSRERQEFLAAAAHDLRVPLVNLRGFAAEVGVAVSELKEALAPALAALPEGSRERVELVLGEELPADLGFIDSSAERMDRLVTAILRLSRLEHRDLNFQRVDMARLAEGILGAITYQLEKHPATVTVEPLPEVTADPIAMEQVLQNLLGNAVAYLQPGRPGRIVVRGRREGDEVIFEVEDNGRGIAPEAQDKVFQIFGRAGAADTEGEGMGLAYVRALLRRHGGRIWFRSRMGEGSVFSFVLPFRS
jgi:signal transduction histidine kinase